MENEIEPSQDSSESTDSEEVSLEDSAKEEASQGESDPIEKDLEVDHSVREHPEPALLSAQKNEKPSLKSAVPVYHVIGITIRETLRSVFSSLKWMGKVTWLYLTNHPSHCILLILLTIGISILLDTGAKLHNEALASRISENSISKIASRSRFRKDYSPSKVAQSGAQAFLNVGAPEWIQKEGVKAVLISARKYNLDLHHQAALLATVDIESGFNPLAKAPTTTACGLFQFVRRTGEMYGMNQSNCMNPWINADTGIRHYIDNYQKRVEQEVEELEETEKLFRTFELSYYLHHDGPNSKNPSHELKAIVLNGTPFLFYVYEILKQEQENQVKQPSYLDTVTTKTEEFFEPVTELVSNLVGSNSATAATISEE